jgi:hypothetical protein
VRFFTFRPRLQHPFYPDLKLAPARRSGATAPALYGAFEDLSAAAQNGAGADRAVFALRRPANPFLSEPQRDALWEWFQVPVLTILLGRDGSPIAYECEAHDGLHLRDDYSGGLLSGHIESRPCECGRPGRRLMPPDEIALQISVEDEALAG